MKVIVNRDELLTRLRKYRKRYETSFNALLVNYKKKAAKYQKEYSDYIEKTKGKGHGPFAPVEPQNRGINYSFYIKMIEAHKEDTVPLEEAEFKKLWMDSWDWMYSHIEELRAGGSAMTAFAASYEEGELNE